MILINNKYICSLLALSFSASLFSQSLVESKLSYNPVLVEKSKQQKTQITFRSSSSVIDTISLGPKGLIEDFSYLGPYPDTAIWLDSMAYINRGFGISPLSLGVATLDGLASNGFPYDSLLTGGSTVSASADTLTSKPIDLSYNLNNPVVDSIYFSFYYQPQGFGNTPEQGDSLVLEFKAPGVSSSWVHIWSKEGYALAANDSSWHLVMISIHDTSFLKKGFQFRFRNYATINASADQWNIDNVYLNIRRTSIDTVLADVSWVYNGTSLIKNYRAMPWRQYATSELVTTVKNLIKNNDTVSHGAPNPKNIAYTYKTLNLTSSTVIDSFKGTVNIFPFLKNKTYTDCDVSLGCISSVPISTSKFPASLTGPTQFAIKHYFNNILGDFSVKDDTLLVINDFSNYFAYDDGGAESEVGLVNKLSGQLALRFDLNVADTLSCVDIYFDPFITNAELYTFYLNAWADDGGTPGSILFTSSSALSPVYKKTGTNVFTRYYLNTPLLLSAGTFYVGFTQNTDQPINIGLDKNNNTQSKTFYNVGNGWVGSAIPGSVMMRPVFGYVVHTDVADYADIKENNIGIYPNPVNDKLHFRIDTYSNSQNITYQIIDVFGRTVVEGTSSVFDYIDVSSLSAGVYFIKIVDGNIISTNKFIKTN